MDEMNIQKASYLSIEIHFASLDAWSEERARIHIEDPSDETQTIRMHQTLNTDAVTDLHLLHCPLFRKNCRQANRRIIQLSPAGRKEFSKDFRRSGR